MISFRKHFLAKIFALFTGLVFLNTCFFMAEVSYMKVTNPDLIQNIAKLISSSGLEEERDHESSDHDASAPEVDWLISNVPVQHLSLYLISTKENHTLEDHYPHANYALTFSPPPDFFQFS